MRRILAALLLVASLAIPAAAQSPWTRGRAISCVADNIGASLTEMTGCSAAPSTQRYYIESAVAQSTTTTAGNFTLESGTGTNCGTGTTALLGGSGTARIAAPANTVAPALLRFEPPLAVTAGHALCVLGVATNTVTITLTGWIAP